MDKHRDGILGGIFSFTICACGRHARFEGNGRVLVMVASKAMAMSFVTAAKERGTIDAWTSLLIRIIVINSSLPDVEEAGDVDHDLGLTSFADPDVRRRVQAANTLIMRRDRDRMVLDSCIAETSRVPQHPN